jgi:two-component system osmolarity sensor histidine kinase EnvZ
VTPRSFAGQTLAVTVAVLLAAQLLTVAFLGLFVLRPQAQRIAAITAQSIAAASDAADIAGATGRAAIIDRLDASDYLDVWTGTTPPPTGGGRPRLLERVFMQALVDAMRDRTDLLWRTDRRQRLWIRVRIGPEYYWVSARSPSALQPLAAVAASAVVTFLLGVAAAFTLQRRLTRPLEALTAAATTYAAGEDAPPVDERGPDEIAALSRSFNAMTARLAANEEDRALLLAGVSHDLRTPLAKLGLAVEMLARGDENLSRGAHAQIAEIDRVLDKFLDFARGFDTEPEIDFDANALVSEIVALRDAEGVIFQHEADVDCRVSGRPEAMRRALVNLTENAVRHGAPPYAVGARATCEGVEIFVRDRGEGVTAESADQMRKAFVRGRQSSGGSGLGLAIADRVATMHGGALRLIRIDPVGFEARIVLYAPRQAP